MKLNSILNEEHQGNVTFEFIIIMALFAVIIFGVAQSPLMDVIHNKIRLITDYITNNNNDANDIWVNM